MSTNNAKIAELKEELADIKAAIKAIRTTGQSYSIGGRSLTRASLPELKKDRADIETRIDRLENGGNVRTWRGVIRH